MPPVGAAIGAIGGLIGGAASLAGGAASGLIGTAVSGVTGAATAAATAAGVAGPLLAKAAPMVGAGVEAYRTISEIELAKKQTETQIDIARMQLAETPKKPQAAFNTLADVINSQEQKIKGLEGRQPQQVVYSAGPAPPSKIPTSIIYAGLALAAFLLLRKK